MINTILKYPAHPTSTDEPKNKCERRRELRVKNEELRIKNLQGTCRDAMLCVSWTIKTNALRLLEKQSNRFIVSL